jgi:hypothetical protein
MNYIMPVFLNSSNPTPMQGAQQQSTEDTVDFRTIPIHDKGDGGAQDAMSVVFYAFGPADLVRIAQKLQREPHLVNTLRAMLG